MFEIIGFLEEIVRIMNVHNLKVIIDSFKSSSLLKLLRDIEKSYGADFSISEDNLKVSKRFKTILKSLKNKIISIDTEIQAPAITESAPNNLEIEDSAMSVISKTEIQLKMEEITTALETKRKEYSEARFDKFVLISISLFVNRCFDPIQLINNVISFTHSLIVEMP